MRDGQSELANPYSRREDDTGGVTEEPKALSPTFSGGKEERRFRYTDKEFQYFSMSGDVRTSFIQKVAELRHPLTYDRVHLYTTMWRLFIIAGGRHVTYFEESVRLDSLTKTQEEMRLMVTQWIYVLFKQKYGREIIVFLTMRSSG